MTGRFSILSILSILQKFMTKNQTFDEKKKTHINL